MSLPSVYCTCLSANCLQSRCNLFKKIFAVSFPSLDCFFTVFSKPVTIFLSDLFVISVRSFLWYFFVCVLIFLRPLHILFTILLVDLFTNSLRSLSVLFPISLQSLKHLFTISLQHHYGPAIDPRTENDPQIEPQMIPRREMIPDRLTVNIEWNGLKFGQWIST